MKTIMLLANSGNIPHLGAWEKQLGDRLPRMELAEKSTSDRARPKIDHHLPRGG